MFSEDFLLDRTAMRQPIDPRRPGIGAEALEVRDTVGMEDVRSVALTREREGAQSSLEPRLETIDEDHSASGRRCRVQQERVIPASSQAGAGTGGKPAESG